MNVNKIRLSGTVLYNPKYSHKSGDARYYYVRIASGRLSNEMDFIHCIIPEELVTKFYAGCRVGVKGTLHCYSNEKNKKKYGKFNILYVLVKYVYEVDKNALDENFVIMSGKVVKPPVQRMTPLGKQIADVVLEHCFQKHDTSCFACILWNENAIRSKDTEVGDEIIVYGRFQSRIYNKQLSDTESREIGTHEICVSKFDYLQEGEEC